MSTDASYAAFVVDQAGPRMNVRAGKMFGEYALYVDEKVVGFICDNRLFLKPTEAGRPFFETLEVGPAYPGSKDYWIGDEVIEEAPRFQDLLRAMAAELPAPKPKKANRDRGPVSPPSSSRPGGSTRRETPGATSEEKSPTASEAKRVNR